jgi:PAS domain S-box-containing protein
MHGRNAKPLYPPRRLYAAVRTLRKALDHCQELVFITDHDGVIQYANRACEILTGYDVRNLENRKIDSIAAELPKGLNWPFMRDRALELGVFRGMTGIRCKSGSIAELDLAMTVVRHPPTRTVTLACTGRAVALRHAIRSGREQMAGTEAIGALAGGIAHDFNNLLMVIGAYAEIGLMNTAAEHPAHRNLQEIQSVVRRASSLTRKLLTFGGQNPKGQQLVSINWIIEDFAGMLARIIEEDIEIRVSLGKEVGMINADPGQIGQVLLNLAVNARDAMPRGGQLTVETQTVQIDSRFAVSHPELQPGEHVVLTVSDTGHGIRTEQLSRIFEPYYTTKPEGKGTGLGLAIVRSIVQQSHGAIEAESSPALGTSFKLYFPLAVTTSRKPPVPWRDEAPVPRGHESLLIVEDSAMLRQSAAEYLSSLGYNVTSAASGPEALQALRKTPNPIALIVADVIMPQMSGPEFARAMTSVWPRTKVLFVSGHTDEVLQRKGVNELGPNFIQKPFSLNSLAVKIREMLDQPVRARAAAASAAR